MRARDLKGQLNDDLARVKFDNIPIQALIMWQSK